MDTLQTAVNEERYDDAIQIFKSIAKPTIKDYVWIGIAEEGQDKHKEAYEHFQEAFKLKPSTPTLATLLAKTAESVNTQDAIKWYKLAAERDENRENALEKIEELKQKPTYTLQFFESNNDFSDIIGMKEIKQKLKEDIIYAVKYPNIYAKHKKKVGAGYIFYGPPGTGKTFLARCLAGECKNVAGKTIKMAVVRISKVLDMYVGNSEKNVSKMFDEARKNAPCILFIDEFDALGKTRSSNSDQASDSSTMSKVVDEFLTEMDGIEKKNEQLFIIAATNRPWEIDESIKRSGRMSNSLYVRPPKYNERILLFQHYTKGKQLGTINWGRLARATMGYSQSDIAEIGDLVALAPIRKEIAAQEKAILLTREERINTITFLMLIHKKKSSIENWYISMKKELIGNPKVEIAQGKKYTTFTQGKLTLQEKKIYKELLEDIRRNTTPDWIMERELMRNIALYIG